MSIELKSNVFIKGKLYAVGAKLSTSDADQDYLDSLVDRGYAKKAAKGDKE